MSKKGFTLVELIVSILVLGIILTMVYRIFFYQEQSLRRQRQWSEINTAQRKASAYISKELRNIGYCDKTNLMGATKAFGIINGQDNSIEYSNDIDGAIMGTVDPEDIHSIRFSGDTLYIDDFFALDNVVSLNFIYTDTTGSVVSPVNEVNTDGDWILIGSEPIEHIEYNLRIALPSSKFSDTVEYTGLATLRNKRP
jgi:prepilin-type N-terminal cleavage/methylation domain-containing protein